MRSPIEQIFSFCLEKKPARTLPGQARSSVLLHSKPCKPSRAHPTQPQYRREPRRGFAVKAGRPVRGSRICCPFTASPEPLSEVRVRKNRCGASSSPRPHDQPGVSRGGSPARMLLPPAISRNEGQSHRCSSSAMRSSANPLPMAPRSNWSLPLSQRMDSSSGSKFHCGKDGLRLQSSRSRRKRTACDQFHSFCYFQQAKAGSLRRIVSPGASWASCAISLLSHETGLKCDSNVSKRSSGGLRSLRGIQAFFVRDTHLKVRRHGAVIEVMDVNHTISFRCG